MKLPRFDWYAQFDSRRLGLAGGFGFNLREVLAVNFHIEFCFSHPYAILSLGLLGFDANLTWFKP